MERRYTEKIERKRQRERKRERKREREGENKETTPHEGGFPGCDKNPIQVR